MLRFLDGFSEENRSTASLIRQNLFANHAIFYVHKVMVSEFLNQILRNLFDSDNSGQWMGKLSRSNRFKVNGCL